MELNNVDEAFALRMSTEIEQWFKEKRQDSDAAHRARALLVH
ncbi:hypothetical protein [Vibrio owensii]